MRFTGHHETRCLRGGRVFVRTYLIAIYHTTTSLSTFHCTVTCEVDTKHGADAGETCWEVFEVQWVVRSGYRRLSGGNGTSSVK